MKKLFLGFLAAAAFAFPAYAQTNCRVSTAAPTYVDGAQAPLSCDTAGNVRTSGGGGGSVTANQGTSNVADPWYVRFASTPTVNAAQSGAWTVGQSGTWTVQPGNTANTTPWLFNLTQINSVALLAGNGGTGTGSPRITIANDSTAIGGWGLGAVNSAAPSGAQMSGARSGANMVPITQADASAPINVSTATTTQLVALSASAVIHVTSFDVIAGGSGNITFVYGTGSSCGTGTTSLTGAYPLTAQAGIAKGNGLGPVLVVPAGNALCVTTSAAVQMSGSVSYTQFVP